MGKINDAGPRARFGVVEGWIGLDRMEPAVP
jgi:hypothetical protein